MTIAEGSAANASIAAKIDNHPAARPQVSIETADIVFEELVEGGMTRYLAIWQSTIPAELGPVRSVRPMDPDIVSPFGGIMAYSGGQARFVAMMQASPVYNAIHGQADTENTFFRTPTKSSPHNVLVKAQDVVAEHTDLPAPAQQFGYATETVPASAMSGTATSVINLVFSQMSTRSWTWDAARGAFARSQDGATDLDTAGSPYGATNVLVLRVPVTVEQDIPKSELVGTGEAWVSSGGHTVHATWSKTAAAEKITLVDDAGAQILLAPGNSWIELVPQAGSVELVPPTTP
ncbi:DUF3048 domain-containing protein [Glaciihabitans tibetensis]|uniref:DUF3048 domain-containing protein n=1 Tax=Glaciihabitans tibetensis TaxID=1266600 RepID=UPI0015E7A529|nr:DUF3048 domain-containing protein [Glaciihabitans tibetensis]